MDKAEAVGIPVDDVDESSAIEGNECMYINEWSKVKMAKYVPAHLLIHCQPSNHHCRP